MRAIIRAFVVVVFLAIASACEITQVRPPDVIFVPRQFEAIQEGNAGKRVLAHSRDSQRLTGQLRDIEATVGELVETACGLTIVQGFGGRDSPTHRFRLQIDHTLTSHIEDFGFGQQIRYQLYRVEAQMFLATNDELIATGVGRAAFSGEVGTRPFRALRGLVRGVDVFPSSPDALETALRQAFTSLCYRIKRVVPPAAPPRSEAPPAYGRAGAIVGAPSPGYKAGGAWDLFFACTPPGCVEIEQSVSFAARFGRAARSGGVPLRDVSPQVIRNGKIVPNPN